MGLCHLIIAISIDTTCAIVVKSDLWENSVSANKRLNYIYTAHINTRQSFKELVLCIPQWHSTHTTPVMVEDYVKEHQNLLYYNHSIVSIYVIQYTHEISILSNLINHNNHKCTTVLYDSLSLQLLDSIHSFKLKLKVQRIMHYTTYQLLMLATT